MQIQKSRRELVLLTISLISIILPPCSSQAQVRKVHPVVSPDDPITIEIIQIDARPSVVRNEFLYFRLYSTGRAEFEDWHQDRSSGSGYEMHTLKLREEEKEWFNRIARRCLSLPNDYDPFQRKEEKVSITRIRIRDEEEYRQVEIHNYIPENEKTKEYYPKAAIELMQRVSGIRKKYHEEA